MPRLGRIVKTEDGDGTGIVIPPMGATAVVMVCIQFDDRAIPIDVDWCC